MTFSHTQIYLSFDNENQNPVLICHYQYLPIFLKRYLVSDVKNLNDPIFDSLWIKWCPLFPWPLFDHCHYHQHHIFFSFPFLSSFCISYSKIKKSAENLLSTINIFIFTQQKLSHKRKTSDSLALKLIYPETYLEWFCFQTGWNKLHFASAQTFVYTKMFAVHDRAHKNHVFMLLPCTGAKISAKLPLCQAVNKIQTRTNPQWLMPTTATFHLLSFKAIPCKLIQYWVPMSKLHASIWESSLHVFLFWLWQGLF